MKSLRHETGSRRAFLAQAFGRSAARLAPTGAMENPAAAVALFDPSACVALVGADCRRCADACPLGERGMRMTDSGPQIQADCDGCGLCIAACGLVNDDPAIRLVPATRPSRHFSEDLRCH
ncbi:MAG: hypothetical protein U0166_09735 [Acidobacteriota bacterium]